MEENKRGGKRDGSGRKSSNNPKETVSIYVERETIYRFGNKEKLKGKLYEFIDNSGKGETVGTYNKNTYAILDAPDTAKQDTHNPVRLAIKRTPPHWVELRRDCENADDYAKWLEDLENDPYLTAREKQQIKQTT